MQVHRSSRGRLQTNSFFCRDEGEPGPSEVLFFALLLIVDAERARALGELQKWAAAVLRDRAAAEQAGPAWEPADAAAVFSRLDAAYASTWEGPDLDRIAAAMALWRGDERWEGSRGGLSAHKSAKLKGMRTAAQRSKGRKGPARWHTYSIMRVAHLLHSNYAELRNVLRLDGGMEAEEAPSPYEENAALKLNVGELELKVLELQGERDRALDAWRQAAKRAKAAAAAKTDVRKQERAKCDEQKKEWCRQHTGVHTTTWAAGHNRR